jgi:hypothetical protein
MISVHMVFILAVFDFCSSQSKIIQRKCLLSSEMIIGWNKLTKKSRDSASKSQRIMKLMTNATRMKLQEQKSIFQGSTNTAWKQCEHACKKAWPRDWSSQ